jgi:multisubunit Na+/H+ antiporter MnhE subunit
MINLQGFSKGTFIVTLIVAVIVSALIFNAYTKKKYNQSIFVKS